MMVRRHSVIRPGHAPLTPIRTGRLSASSRPAAVTLELALVAPVFFFLVFGIIEVGRGFMVSHLLNNAARDGCRAAIVGSTSTSQIQAVVKNVLEAQGVAKATTTVKVNGAAVDANTAKEGDKISVLITIPVKDFTWLPGSPFMEGNISGQFSLRRE